LVLSKEGTPTLPRCLSDKVTRIRSLFQVLALLASESGQVGTGIAFICLVGTACALDAVVVTSGEYGVGNFERVFRVSLGRVGATMEVRGSVVATASGEPLAVDRIQFVVGTIGEGDAIPLDSALSADRLIIAYLDGTAFDVDVPYTAVEIVGNGNNLLEPGESALLTIKLADIDGGEGPPSVGPNSRWTLELQAPVGGTADITRVMPAQLERVMQLR
jgi:archaellin